ncbi:endolytic transglycosylase MltG [Nocardioides sp. Kera G14]|uniref:endolytic transglycosylase MltG n=1 Tax=Nocardioides sp. Kera G14 TaxID=2884264 RepID=UPI001D11B330|nr:endolytic transglycosylase MltG [Nocardioides sp. Kera G14]UDY22165.1 endolytic transglycosylase MltG [Nocardioides sp. Kera G14]
MTESPEEIPGADQPFVPGLDDTAERPAVRPDPEPEPEAEKQEYVSTAGRRRAERTSSRLPGCLAVLVALVIVAGGAWFAWGKISDKLDGLGGSSDYSAGSTGADVTFQVNKGDTVAAIGRNLKAAGVIKSVDSFISAAQANPDSSGIQVGYYTLQKQMPAADALEVLVDPKNIVTTTVTIREGLRLDDIVATLVKKTGVKKADFTAALKDPSAIGLPDSADGNAEGYLFPATYAFGPKDTAVDMLSAMVAKGVSEFKELDIDGGAKKLGFTVDQIVTVASILEYEANRDEDYPKVARAIYNRLDQDMPLQSDATVAYANGLSGEVWTTAEQRAIDSPYNTYTHQGLPPGPIGAPGEATLKAALNPAEGDWLYWVVINLKTGETVFSDNLADHNAAVAKFREYCTTSDAC